MCFTLVSGREELMAKASGYHVTAQDVPIVLGITLSRSPHAALFMNQQRAFTTSAISLSSLPTLETSQTLSA
jgi:hypothetical protein